MKKIFILSNLLFFAFQGMSQEYPLNRCATTEYMNYREGIQPGYIESTKETFDFAKATQKNSFEKSNEKYIIPVVVHIVL